MILEESTMTTLSNIVTSINLDDEQEYDDVSDFSDQDCNNNCVGICSDSCEFSCEDNCSSSCDLTE